MAFTAEYMERSGIDVTLGDFQSENTFKLWVNRENGPQGPHFQNVDSYELNQQFAEEMGLKTNATLLTAILLASLTNPAALVAGAEQLGRARPIGEAPRMVVVGPYTPEGLAAIEEHLNRLGALEDPPNAAMVARLRAGETSIQDINFYTHELREGQLMRGIEYSNDASRAAHLKTLEWQGIPYEPGYESQLYHPDVIRQHPEFFNPAAWPK
jgi:hypothetical protein